MNVPKEFGGLFGVLNVYSTEVHGSFTIDLEKMILYKVIPLQTLSSLDCDFYDNKHMGSC